MSGFPNNGDLGQGGWMSRTTFAVRFKAAAGVAPPTYLTRWRTRLAERALQDGGTKISAIASMLGYDSKSAFSNAFRRVTGKAPKHYRRTG